MATDPLKVEQSAQADDGARDAVAGIEGRSAGQLRSQLETALREANRRAATKDILDQQMQEARAAALDRLRDRRRVGARSGKAQATDGSLQFADGRRPLRGGR